MPRPGVTVELLEDAPSGQAVLNSGQSFFIGVAERGRLQAVRVGSVADYTREFGDRAGGSVLHDSVSAYFSEGGATLWVSTIAGPGALAATAQLPPYNVAAAGTGEWGNDLTVEAVDAAATGGTGAVQIVVTYDGTIVERSPILIPSAPEAGESWNSDYVHLDYSTGDLAVGGPVDLAGGVDDATVTAATITAALDRFTYALGPGQVAYPGATTTMAFDALLAHVDKTRRVALLDAPDTSDPAALKALAQTVSQNPLAKYAAMFAPWATYPGAGNTTVTVPYSPVQAGLLARSDAATQNPNLAAAGTNGIARSALGLSKSYSDSDRQALNEAGLTLAVQKYGTIRTYGARSLAGAGNLTWLWFGGAREVCAVAHEADAIGENYVLKQIDGQGTLFAALNADLKGMLLEHYARGALYGATPEEAFSVNTGASINTPATIANGEVHAIIRLKTSPTAEWVHVVIVKTALDRALAA